MFDVEYGFINFDRSKQYIELRFRVKSKMLKLLLLVSIYLCCHG